MKPVCEIIYVKGARNAKGAQGWKWRVLDAEGRPAAKASEETFELFYDCVRAARASGYVTNVKCL